MFLSTDINLPGAVDWVMMQSGFLFMLVLEKREKCDSHQLFFTIVQLDGTLRQAENFTYRLELNKLYFIILVTTVVNIIIYCVILFFVLVLFYTHNVTIIKLELELGLKNLTKQHQEFQVYNRYMIYIRDA